MLGFKGPVSSRAVSTLPKSNAGLRKPNQTSVITNSAQELDFIWWQSYQKKSTVFGSVVVASLNPPRKPSQLPDPASEVLTQWWWAYAKTPAPSAVAQVLPSRQPSQSLQGYEPLPELSLSYWEQYRDAPVPLTFLSTPFPTQKSQRFDELPELGWSWEQYRDVPIPLTFLPTPFPLQRSQRFDNLPEFDSWYEQFTKQPGGSVAVSTNPSTRQGSQRWDELIEANFSFWDQFRDWFIPFAGNVTVQAPWLRQPSQRIDLLSEFDSWYEQFTRQSPTSSVTAINLFRQASQRWDELPDFNFAVWDQYREWPVPQNGVVPVVPDSWFRPAGQRYDQLPDENWQYWNRSYPAISLPTQPYVRRLQAWFEQDAWAEGWGAFLKPRTVLLRNGILGLVVRTMPLFLNAAGKVRTLGTPLSVLGSTNPAIVSSIPLVTYSSAQGNHLTRGMAMSLLSDSLAHAVRNMNLSVRGGTISLSSAIALLVKNTQLASTLMSTLFVAGDGVGPGGVPSSKGMNLFLKRWPSSAIPLFIAGPGVPTNSALTLFIASLIASSGNIPLVMPKVVGAPNQSSTLYINGF